MAEKGDIFKSQRESMFTIQFIEIQFTAQYIKMISSVSQFRWDLPLVTQKEVRTEGMFTALIECLLRLVNK